MTDAADIGTALQIAAPLVTELARAIAAGLDERAAVERAIERWRAVAPPVAAEVSARIDRIAGRPDAATERLLNRWSPAMAALAGVPVRVYVAGSSAERSRVRAAMDAVRDAGLELTLDWLAHVERVGHASPTDPDVRAQAARADLDAIDRADVVWLLAPQPGSTSTGAWTELGYALAHGKRVIVSGDATRSIFVSGAEAEVATDGEALALIRRRPAIPMPPVLATERAASPLPDGEP